MHYCSYVFNHLLNVYLGLAHLVSLLLKYILINSIKGYKHYTNILKIRISLPLTVKTSLKREVNANLTLFSLFVIKNLQVF